MNPIATLILAATLAAGMAATAQTDLDGSDLIITGGGPWNASYKNSNNNSQSVVAIYNLANGTRYDYAGSFTGNLFIDITHNGYGNDENRFTFSNAGNSIVGGLEMHNGILFVSNDNQLVSYTGGLTLDNAVFMAYGECNFNVTVPAGSFGGMRAGGGNLVLNRKVTGAGDLVIVPDSNSVTLNGTNDYAGVTSIGTVQGGTNETAHLILDADNTLPSTTVVEIGKSQNATYSYTGATTATLDLNGTTQTISGLYGAGNATIVNGTDAPANLTINLADGASYDYSGTIAGNSAANPINLTVAGAGNQTISGNFTNASLTKSGSGTLTLGGDSVSLTALTVTEGTLAIAPNTTSTVDGKILGVSCVVTTNGNGEKMTFVLAGSADGDGVADVAVYADETGAGDPIWAANGVTLTNGVAEFTVPHVGGVTPGQGQHVFATFYSNNRHGRTIVAKKVMVAPPVATLTKVRQDFPWSNDVEIEYSITGCAAGSADDYALRFVVTKGSDEIDITDAVGSPAVTNTVGGKVVWQAPADIAAACTNATLTLSVLDRSPPTLTLGVESQNGDFAGTATITEESRALGTRSFQVAVRTASNRPRLIMTFADAHCAITSIRHSADGTNFVDVSVSGRNQSEQIKFDLAAALGASLADGATAPYYFQTSDAAGNVATYALGIHYLANARFSVGGNARASLDGPGTYDSQHAVLYTNDPDGSTDVVVSPGFAFGQGDSAPHRIGVEFGGATYWSGFQVFDANNASATVAIEDCDGLMDALGAQGGVILDGTYALKIWVQDDYVHAPQRVGGVQTLVIDTTAPVLDYVSVDGEQSNEVNVQDKSSFEVVVKIAQSEAKDVSVDIADKLATIPAGELLSDPIVLDCGSDYVYGKNDYTVTLTDLAGNQTTAPLTIWYNTTPEATSFDASGNEWGPGNKGIDGHGEPFDYSSRQYVALDFAGNVDDNNQTPVENLSVTVSQDALANGTLYKNEYGVFVELEPDSGFYWFYAGDAVYYLPNRYWSGTETIPFVVTDDANTPATGDIKNVVVTISPVTSQTEVVWTSPAPVVTNSVASEQVIGRFTYPSTKPRSWSVDWLPGAIAAHVLEDGSDSVGALFATNPSFSVVEGDTVDGLTSYSVVMSGWVLAENVWGTEDFIGTLSGALVSDPTDVIGENSSQLTFTVNGSQSTEE